MAPLGLPVHLWLIYIRHYRCWHLVLSLWNTCKGRESPDGRIPSLAIVCSLFLHLLYPDPINLTVVHGAPRVVSGAPNVVSGARSINYGATCVVSEVLSVVYRAPGVVYGAPNKHSSRGKGTWRQESLDGKQRGKKWVSGKCVVIWTSLWSMPIAPFVILMDVVASFMIDYWGQLGEILPPTPK